MVTTEQIEPKQKRAYHARVSAQQMDFLREFIAPFPLREELERQWLYKKYKDEAQERNHSVPLAINPFFMILKDKCGFKIVEPDSRKKTYYVREKEVRAAVDGENSVILDFVSDGGDEENEAEEEEEDEEEQVPEHPVREIENGPDWIDGKKLLEDFTDKFTAFRKQEEYFADRLVAAQEALEIEKTARQDAEREVVRLKRKFNDMLNSIKPLATLANVPEERV